MPVPGGPLQDYPGLRHHVDGRGDARAALSRHEIEPRYAQLVIERWQGLLDERRYGSMAELSTIYAAETVTAVPRTLAAT